MKHSKIVIVTDAWLPQVNGVVITFETLKTILEERGYEVEILHPGMFSSVRMPFYPEVPLVLFAGRSVGNKLEASNADYIHIATEGPLGWAARNWCVRNKVPFTTSYHTHFALYLEKWTGSFVVPAVLSILRRFHAPATHTLLGGQDLLDEMHEYGFKHLKLWPHGVDTTCFSRDMSGDIPELPKPVFVYFGRISREKNIEEFLNADLPGTKLLIGDGPYRKKLERKYGASAHFVGYQSGQDLIRWLSRADVLVFPSRTDTFAVFLLPRIMSLVLAAYSRQVWMEFWMKTLQKPQLQRYLFLLRLVAPQRVSIHGRPLQTRL
jgi:glycosyltransferase involved in cell wall biosynthesis